MKTKTIDFKSIEIQDLDGKIEKFDISKVLGNYLYINTGDLGVFEVARIIYHTGEIELTEIIKSEIQKAINDPRCPFTAILKNKLIELINKE